MERREQSAPDALDATVIEWLAEQEATGLFNWRYYFVRYPDIFCASRGIYVLSEYDSTGVGYGLRGRHGQRTRPARPLLALWEQLGEPTGITKPVFRSWGWDREGDEVHWFRDGDS